MQTGPNGKSYLSYMLHVAYCAATYFIAHQIVMPQLLFISSTFFKHYECLNNNGLGIRISWSPTRYLLHYEMLLSSEFGVFELH